MKRFRTPLIALSRLRNHQRRSCELELAHRNAHKVAARQALGAAEVDHQEHAADAASLLQAGLSAAGLHALRSGLDQESNRIDGLRKNDRDANEQVRDAVESLRKSLAAATAAERLLDQQRSRFRRDCAKREQSELDEVASSRRNSGLERQGGES